MKFRIRISNYSSYSPNSKYMMYLSATGEVSYECLWLQCIGWLALCLVASACAMLSKEAGLTVLVLCAFYDVLTNCRNVVHLFTKVSGMRCSAMVRSPETTWTTSWRSPGFSEKHMFPVLELSSLASSGNARFFQLGRAVLRRSCPGCAAASRSTNRSRTNDRGKPFPIRWSKLPRVARAEWGRVVRKCAPCSTSSGKQYRLPSRTIAGICGGVIWI